MDQHNRAARRFAKVAIMVCALAVAALTPTVALAAGFQPDGRIRVGNAAYVGNNIYNTTAVNQAVDKSKAIGQTIYFRILIQNDSATTTDSFTLAATGTSSAMFTVTYFRGTTNITSAVVAGTYTTAPLAPGGTYLIWAHVKVNSSATVHASTSRVVTITSVGNPTKRDAVRFVGART